MSTLGYFDYLGSTPLDPRVSAVMLGAWATPGNASAQDHAFGWRAAETVNAARREVAHGLGALEEEIVFTSGATEANNLMLIGAARAAPSSRRRLLVSPIEHKSVLAPAQALEAEGFSREFVTLDRSGRVDLEAFAAQLDDTVAVVSIMAVNNEIGVIQEVAALSRLTAQVGAFLHVDATQAPAAMPVDLHSWGCDGASLSAHKIYGPGGVGAAYVSDVAPWRPHALVTGGGQENGLRAGTVPQALCAGFARAIGLLKTHGDADRQHAARLRSEALKVLRRHFGEVIETAANAPRHPGCLHVRLKTVDAADLLLRLQPRIAAAIGSACTSGTIGPSHVLRALGWTDADAAEALRFSVGRFSTDQDVALLDEALSSFLVRAA